MLSFKIKSPKNSGHDAEYGEINKSDTSESNNREFLYVPVPINKIYREHNKI